MTNERINATYVDCKAWGDAVLIYEFSPELQRMTVVWADEDKELCSRTLDDECTTWRTVIRRIYYGASHR